MDSVLTQMIGQRLTSTREAMVRNNRNDFVDQVYPLYALLQRAIGRTELTLDLVAELDDPYLFPGDRARQNDLILAGYLIQQVVDMLNTDDFGTLKPLDLVNNLNLVETTFRKHVPPLTRDQTWRKELWEREVRPKPVFMDY